MQAAVSAVQSRTDLLSLCDEVPANKDSEDSNNNMIIDTPDQ